MNSETTTPTTTPKPWLGLLRAYPVVIMAAVVMLAEAALLATVPNSIYREGFWVSLLGLSLLTFLWFSVFDIGRNLVFELERFTRQRSRTCRIAMRTFCAIVITVLGVVYVCSWAIYFRAERFANIDGFQFIFENPFETTWLYMGSGERAGLIGLAIGAVVAVPVLAFFIGWIAKRIVLPVVPVEAKLTEQIFWRVAGLTMLCATFVVVSDSNPVQKGLRFDALRNSVNPFVTLAAATVDRMMVGKIPDCLNPADLRPIESWEPPTATDANRPSVVFIAIESLRADVVHQVHQGREITPNLNRLTKKSVNFTHAYSQSTHSDYADVCIVSSLYPLRKQSHHYYNTNDPWPKTLMFDVFKPAGYETAIISSQNESWGGMDRFLDTKNLDLFYDAKRYQQNHAAGGEARKLKLGECDYGAYGCLPDQHTMDVALQWVSQQSDAGKPFALSMNFQSSHFPFELPEGVEQPFQPSQLDSDITFMNYPVAKTPVVRNAYFNAIHYCDFQLGRMIDRLEQLQILDDVVLVVLGENGEAFHENGSVGHGQNPVEPGIHVANVIHAPRYLAAGVEDYPTELIDLLPTVLNLIDWPANANFQGIDVLSADRPPLDERLLFFHTNSAVSTADAVQLAGRWKYMMNHLTGQAHMFDLANDPGESKDVSGSHPELANQLRSVLQQWRNRQLAYYHYPKNYTGSYPPLAPKWEAAGQATWKARTTPPEPSKPLVSQAP